MNRTLTTQINLRNGYKGKHATAANNGSVALLAGKTCLTGKMKTPIKLLLVDDHPIVRRGVASCLSKEPNIHVIGEAAHGREAIIKVRELNPDVVLMDVD